MNAKIDKLAREIDKTRARIAEDQERLAVMEKQKIDMEDIEVVKLYRSAEIDPREIAAFIQSFRENGATAVPPDAPFPGSVGGQNAGSSAEPDEYEEEPNVDN